MTPMMKSKAILFGINYKNDDDSRLRGCINDVHNMAEFLKNNAKYDIVKIHTDEIDDTKVKGHSIINSLYKLALDSHRFKLEKVWIHFSGHGCSLVDRTGDERDGYDECIVPVDYKKVGVITDDLIKRILRYFNKDTKVTCIFDCCHSGTIGDLKYNIIDKKNYKIEHNNSKCNANVLLISGCMDNQTSSDAYNVRGRREFSGAMTSCLLTSMNDTNKVFDVLERLKLLLKRKRFTQIPQLSSSYLITDKTFLY